MKLGRNAKILCALTITALAALPSMASAQADPAPPPAADPADVESVDAIVAAVYDVISGPAGQARDWDRWRSLFIPEAQIISVRRGAPGFHGAHGHRLGGHAVHGLSGG